MSSLRKRLHVSHRGTITPAVACLLAVLAIVMAAPAFGQSPDLKPGEGIDGLTSRITLDPGTRAPVCSTNPLKLIYRGAGATDDGAQGAATRKEATSVHCTNFATSDTEIEVQVIQWNGSDLYCGVVTAPPGRSFTFSTQNTTIYFDDVLIGGSPGTPAIFQGSILVWASGSDIRCAAQVLDPLNYPPVYMGSLELYR